MVGTRRYAFMRARMESDYKELQVIIEPMNMKQERLLATMERKQKLVSGAPEDLRKKVVKEIRILDDRISAEEAELFEERVEVEELLKEGRTKAEEWRASEAKPPRRRSVFLTCPGLFFLTAWARGEAKRVCAVEKSRRQIGKQWYDKNLRRHRTTCLAKTWRWTTTSVLRSWVSFRVRWASLFG